jgi:hypothetical protein
MDQQRIAQILSNAAGNPETGNVHAIIPAMAAALHEALTGQTGAQDRGTPSEKAKEENRVVKATETR